jgi:hypothetical protein
MPMPIPPTGLVPITTISGSTRGYVVNSPPSASTVTWKSTSASHDCPMRRASWSMPPSHISTDWRITRMSRSAVGEAGTSTSTST